jgi:glyoxylase-like metal-dependent hydrolase (beta-lactamase superfamily II)
MLLRSDVSIENLYDSGSTSTRGAVLAHIDVVMPESTATVTVSSVSGADADVISTLYPIPALGFVPINAFVLRAEEPVLVDTGPIVLRDLYFDAISKAIDLDDLRWIYLTHADPDHVGCLREVLAAAPNARVITTFLGLGKLGLYAPISPERVYLLNPGQRLSVGDRELIALEPPTFDAPETTAFVDSKTDTLFSSDCFGGVLAEPAELAAEIPAAALRDGVVTWAGIDAPWLGRLDVTALDVALARIRELAAPIVLSSHLPPAFGMLDTLVDHIATAHGRPRFVGPDQAALAALLASLAGEPDAETHLHA